jgi:hypothetical protein
MLKKIDPPRSRWNAQFGVCLLQSRAPASGGREPWAPTTCCKDHGQWPLPSSNVRGRNDLIRKSDA